MPRRANGEAGFVITLELILIFTILGIGLLAGIIAVRNALFVWALKKQAQTVWVFDANGVPLGPARDFDEHEAPRLFYIDRELSDPGAVPPDADPDPSWVGHNYRAFVGVRDDRFTTRHRIFYTRAGCTGVACISAAGDEDADSHSIGFLATSVMDSNDDFTISIPFPLVEAGAVGYLYPLQHGPSYGVGADLTLDSGGLPGTLYRQTTDNCEDDFDVGGSRPNVETILSVWTSQQVVSGPSCYNLTAEPIVGGSNCPAGANLAGDPVEDPGDPCQPQNNTSSNCELGYICSGGDSTGLPCLANADCLSANYCSSPNAPSCCPGGCNDAGAACLNTPDSGDLRCRCPGWGTAGFGDDWIENGSNCCPPGTTPGQGGGGVGVVCNIATENFLNRASVVNPFDDTNFQWPFYVNLPPNPLDFTFLAPSGIEGDPGTDTGIPYSPVDFVFDRAPDGE